MCRTRCWRRSLCCAYSGRFLADYELGVTADLAQAFANSGKSQLLAMEVDRPDISKYRVVVPHGAVTGIAGLVEKLMQMMQLQTLPLSAAMFLCLIYSKF